MARGNGKSYGYPSPWNETDSGELPDNDGKGIYYDGMDEILKMHLAQTGPMDETANSKSGGGIMGGVAPGEPEAARGGTGKKRD